MANPAQKKGPTAQPTRRHRRLSEIAARDELADEIAGSKRELEDRLGLPCRYFAWPFGRASDIDARGLELIAESGYEASFSAIRGRVVPQRTRPLDDIVPTDEVLEVVGLTEQRDIRVRKLSGGQQRRLDVAVGLAGDPELLFLDEPTTGFDPGARRGAWEMIRNLQALGKTVLLTTHYMDEAEQLADRRVAGFPGARPRLANQCFRDTHGVRS